jgi:hypothetical protein
MSLDQIRREFGPNGLIDVASVYGRVGASVSEAEALEYTFRAKTTADERSGSS